jgi:uncharacterized protein
MLETSQDNNFSLGPHKRVSVEETPEKGRGLFALDPINAGEIIDVTPVLIVDEALSKTIMQYPKVADSLLIWDGNERNVNRLAIGFGPLSMCNHAVEANAGLQRIDFPSPRFALIAKKEIRIGEEITLSYRMPLQSFKNP